MELKNLSLEELRDILYEVEYHKCPDYLELNKLSCSDVDSNCNRCWIIAIDRKLKEGGK